MSIVVVLFPFGKYNVYINVVHRHKEYTKMKKLVMIRHGESEWNRENRFTGWTDVDLSDKGIQEAVDAGELLRAEGILFDAAYTSLLKRSIRTLWIILDCLDRMWIPVYRSWRLNEKHYGSLQGLNKKRDSGKIRRRTGTSMEARLSHSRACS